jgi:hypothetical protein
MIFSISNPLLFRSRVTNSNREKLGNGVDRGAWILNGPGHYPVDDLVRHVRVCFGGRGDNGFHPAIARTQIRAFSLFVIPGKCRRSSTITDSSPLFSNA